MGSARHFVTAIILAFALQFFEQRLLPHGYADGTKASDVPVFSQVDTSIKDLTLKSGKLKRIYERVPEGNDPILVEPETIFFDRNSRMYTFTHHGKLLRFDNLAAAPDDKYTIYADLYEIAESIGRPLGGKFVPGSDVLYFADTLLGLCRIDLSKNHPKMELVASKVQLDDGSWSPILYADDVDVGNSGIVYFSDATDIAPERESDLTYDIIYPSQLDIIRNKRAGRLLSYNPLTDEVKVLAMGIHFANGVAVNKDETIVMVVEGSMFRILMYHLAGPKQGELEVAVDNLPGFVDGIDYDHTSGMWYATLPSNVVTLMKILYKMPQIVEAVFRTMLMIVPKRFSPQPESYTGIVEIARVGSECKVKRIVQDPDGEDIRMITGVTVKDSQLFLGSLVNNFVGVYDL